MEQQLAVSRPKNSNSGRSRDVSSTHFILPLACWLLDCEQWTTLRQDYHASNSATTPTTEACKDCDEAGSN